MSNCEFLTVMIIIEIISMILCGIILITFKLYKHHQNEKIYEK